jgi:hypothetical protein
VDVRAKTVVEPSRATTEPVALTRAEEYIVQPGDSFAAIAKKKYGDEKYMDLIARANPSGDQGETQSFSAAMHGNAIFGFAELGKLLLKCLHLTATHKGGVAEAFAKNLDQLFFEFQMGCL